MKKMLLAGVLMLAGIHCTGCATIVGGIIGYQSGEAVAGAAIGAAIDITGAIISNIEHKEEEQKREIQEKEREIKRKEAIKIYAEEGYIRVGSISATGKMYGEELKRKFDNIGWQYTEVTEKPSREDALTKRVFQCQTTDDKKFTLELLREKNQDLLVFIKPAEANKELQSMVTSQVGIWVREIAGQ
ncbi:MAG: hypothetical protein JW787_14160 [Sedimentisphaerales bacterium]|nr:hypothetical protein [Sedimentisphaerales bacterium]